MLEAARILAILSVLALGAGLLGWVKLFRSPALQRLDGRQKRTFGRAEMASQLLALAVGLSAVAAVLAVAAWVLG